MNIFFPPNQGLVFLNMTMLGIFLGVLYDAFSIKRKLLGKSIIICFIDDVVYVLVCGCAFLITAFVTNNGIIRWYEFFTCVFGFSVYKLTVSRLVMHVMNRIIVMAKKLFVKLLKALIIIFKPLNVGIFKRMLLILLRPLFSYLKLKSIFLMIKFGFVRMCRIGK